MSAIRYNGKNVKDPLNHTDTYSDIFGYECKMDASDSDSNSNIDLTYELTFRYFLY